MDNNSYNYKEVEFNPKTQCLRFEAETTKGARPRPLALALALALACHLRRGLSYWEDGRRGRSHLYM